MRRSVIRALALSAGVCAAVLVLAPAAGAHRKPTKNEAKAIDKAAHASSATRGVGCFKTRRIVVSTAGPWAKASLVPCKPNVDTVLAVFERSHGKWALRDLGSSGVGCGVVPRVVRTDLALSCP